MDNKATYRVSFRVASFELDPNEITRLLGIEPDHAHKKGDPNFYITKKIKELTLRPIGLEYGA